MANRIINLHLPSVDLYLARESTRVFGDAVVEMPGIEECHIGGCKFLGKKLEDPLIFDKPGELVADDVESLVAEMGQHLRTI